MRFVVALFVGIRCKRINGSSYDSTKVGLSVAKSVVGDRNIRLEMMYVRHHHEQYIYNQSLLRCLSTN